MTPTVYSTIATRIPVATANAPIVSTACFIRLSPFVSVPIGYRDYIRQTVDLLAENIPFSREVFVKFPAQCHGKWVEI
jgi:hypothetical protein